MATSPKKSASEYVDEWQRLHHGVSAAGVLLREQLRDCWTRCHYFADDRRAPSNDVEARHVVRQVLSILARVFDGPGPLLVFLFSFDRSPCQIAQDLALEPLPAIPPSWQAALDPFMDLSELVLYVGAVDPGTAAFEGALLAAANDQIGGLTIWAANRLEAVLPYDGGIDLFIPDPVKRRTIVLAWSTPSRLH